MLVQGIVVGTHHTTGTSNAVTGMFRRNSKSQRGWGIAPPAMSVTEQRARTTFVNER